MGATYNKVESTWTFPTGSTFKFRFLERDQDVHKYQGHQYTWIGFDELTNWPTDYPFMYMLTRNRSAKGVPCYTRAAGNPGGAGQAWVKAMFIDGKIPEKVYKVIEIPDLDLDTMEPKVDENGNVVMLTLEQTFIPAKLTDNTELMKKDPSYRVKLAMQPTHIRRALLDGDWSVFSGQVFEEFSYEKHVVKPFPLEPSWVKWAAMDWGYSRPFSIQWFAITGDGRVIMYREWYGVHIEEDGSFKANKGAKMNASEVAKRAWELSFGEGCTQMVADPACWSKSGIVSMNGEDAASIAETFAAVGWTMEKANNDRLNGLARLHDMLQTTGENGVPSLIFFNTCHHLIRTLPALTADPRRPEDVDTTAEDHCFAAGTLVQTDAGKVRIEDIRVGDMVLTRAGYREVLDTWDHGEQDTKVYTFSNGSRIEATPGHKIFTQRGKVPIDTLRYDDVVYQAEGITWKENSTESSLGRLASIIGQVARIASEALSLCIGRFGSIIVGKSLMATTSTTWMGTPITMQSQTSHLSKDGITFQCTGSGRQQCRLNVWKLRRNGIEAKKGDSGTRVMQRNPGNIRRYIKILARSVAASIRLISRRDRNTAAVHVGIVRFKGVEEGGRKLTYDLTVHEHHEYFAENILVSNSYDSLRYMVMHLDTVTENSDFHYGYQDAIGAEEKNDYDILEHGYS
ncbi:terminase large subunit [Rhodobacteraceae phage LS06-2018-MD07]|nr:terminase large subunit [Rhodobacteraceae phage LS06-2018-MD07]